MAIRLLIVDDHEIVRFGLHTVFDNSNGLEVVGEAGDGIAAISRCVEFAPDVVLMDIRMPVMDGIEATREIKSKLPNTRVLMLTSNDNQEDMFAALAAGADGYCLKNTPGNLLIMAIETIYSGSTWLDPKIAHYVMKAALSPPPPNGQPDSKKSAFGLSPREIEVLALLVDGCDNAEIATRLVISHETVKTHMRHIMEKLRVSDRTQAAVKAMREGLL
jgi:DNA-binding NarL/FixJ family response regulator